MPDAHNKIKSATGSSQQVPQESRRPCAPGSHPNPCIDSRASSRAACSRPNSKADAPGSRASSVLDFEEVRPQKLQMGGKREQRRLAKQQQEVTKTPAAYRLISDMDLRQQHGMMIWEAIRPKRRPSLRRKCPLRKELPGMACWLGLSGRISSFKGVNSISCIKVTKFRKLPGP